MTNLTFITGNANKFKEVKAYFPDVAQLDLDLPEIQELDAHVIVRTKLEAAAPHHVGAMMIEDTSLYFDGLNGLPGPLSKWFLKTVGAPGLYKMCEAFGNFAAEARTIIGYRSEAGEITFFEGATRGTIVPPRGTSSFGWDAIFLPDGLEKTYFELTTEEKNAVSQRGKALKKLSAFLQR